MMLSVLLVSVDDLRRMDKISSGTLEACATVKLPPHTRRKLHAFLIKARLSVCLEERKGKEGLIQGQSGSPG